MYQLKAAGMSDRDPAGTKGDLYCVGDPYHGLAAQEADAALDFVFTAWTLCGCVEVQHLAGQLPKGYLTCGHTN